MRILLAVLQDLYLFALDALRSLFVGKRNKQEATLALPAREHQDELSGGEARSLEEAIAREEVKEIFQPTFRSTAEILEESPRPEKNTVMYTGSEHTPLFRQPTAEFDGIIAKIPYGAMVMVLESRGRWARIAYKEATGWVLRDELVDRSAYIYPDFTIGEANSTEDPATLRVRACIDDEFGGGVAELPLQSSEYVLYKLTKKGVTMPWPKVRPRTEGTWHTILKGIDGVHIGVQACAGCVMEYVREDGVGHVAYVEAVFPDETISISEANYPDQGMYNERVLTKEEWRELKPIFIEVR